MLSDNYGNSIIREELTEEFLDPIVLRLWVATARSTQNYLSSDELDYLRSYDKELPTHIWTFDSPEDIDREKEGKGKMIECALGANNRGLLLFQAGLDIDSHDEQAAEAYGFENVEEYRKAVATATFSTSVKGAFSESEDDESSEGKVNDTNKTKEAKKG